MCTLLSSGLVYPRHDNTPCLRWSREEGAGGGRSLTPRTTAAACIHPSPPMTACQCTLHTRSEGHKHTHTHTHRVTASSRCAGDTYGGVQVTLSPSQYCSLCWVTQWPTFWVTQWPTIEYIARWVTQPVWKWVTFTPLGKATLKTPIKLPVCGKQPIIAEVWVVYGYYFLFLPILDPYIPHILQATHTQPSPYHGYNYSYLMLTNFIGSSYMSYYFLLQ